MADSTAASKAGSSDAKNVIVGQPADVNAFVTPVKKKKRILKKIPSRPKSDINLSKGKLKSISTPKNYSFLNVSVQKQTLRANNRVLAQSLAKAREELRDANNRIFQLHREQQDILQENNRLHRVAGLKDEEIEAEVQKRLQLLMMDMKTNLREISHHMLKSGEILNELHEKCLTYSRPSVSGSRSLSTGNISSRSSDGGLHCNTNTRSIYYQSSKLNQPSTHDFLAKADELEMGRFSTNMCVVEGHNDMSLIMEQSTLDDTELGEMAAIVPLPAVSESAEHPSLQKAEVGLPQRVRIRRNSGVEKAEKQDPKGGNLQSASKQMENNAEEVKHEPSKAEYVEKLEKREQFTPKSDELKVRADTSISEEKKSNYTSALTNNKDSKEVINPKKRRETFVVPLSVLQKGENHKKDSAATLSNFEPLEFENIDDETISLVSGSPISAVDSENELKEVPGPSGDGENIKCKRETFYLPNPFKPTKEPIRTPPKISSQEVLAKLIHNQATDELQDQSCAKMWPSYPEEEVTTFFNTDMEFTAVIDTKKFFEEGENTLNLDNTSLKDVTKIGLSKVTKIGKLKGSTENKNEEPGILKSKGNDASDDEEKQRKSSKKEEEKIKGHVELRLAKPGKIVFSATRKQPDGRRMPAPAKPASKTKLKQKKTVIETPSKESNKISSIFDFHDRTPNVTLEQTDHLKQGKSVYDISLNETTKDEPLPSLKEFKDKLLREPHVKAAKQGTLECAKHVNMDVDNSTRKGILEGTKRSRSQSRSNPISKLKKADEDKSSLDKSPSNEEKSSSDSSLMLLKEVPIVHVENPEQMSENIYYLPLKGGSSDEDSKRKHRGRSKSRSKNAAPESDNKDDIEATSSRNRSKSRSRLKRAKNESDSDEEWKPSQGRSRSRPRSKKTMLEDQRSVKKKELESCRGRSRSRPRPKETLMDSDNEDEAVSLKPSTRSKSRSRSKLRLDSPSKEEVINENTSSLKSSRRKAEESEKIEMIEHTADSIIYSLPLKGCSDDEATVEKSQQRSDVNSRSRSRSRSKAGIVPIKPDAAKDTDETTSTTSTSDNKGGGEATSSRNRSKSRSRLKRAKNESDSDEEWKPSQGRSRSRPRSMKTMLEDQHSVKKKELESCRGRSRSRPRPKETLIDSDNKDEAVSLKPSTRSQSRSRSKPRLNSPSKEEVINENTSRSKSSRKKAEESDKIEMIEHTTDSIIYSLPLKGCSDDETSIEKSQQRSNVNSRSRSRSQSKAGIVPIKPDAAEETDESKRHKGKRVKSCSSQEDNKNLSIYPNLKTPTSKETRKKSIKEKDSISVHEDAKNIDVLSHEKHSQNLLSVSPNSIFIDIEVHRIQSDDNLMTKIDKENNLHSSPTSLIEEKIHPKVEQILSKENGEKFDHFSFPLDKDCSSGATNSDPDSSMRFVTKMRGESLKMDQIEDKILEVTEENIKTSTEDTEENDSKAVKSSKSKICKSTAKKSRRVRETDTKESTPLVETTKEGKLTSKKENSKDEKENQSLKNIRKRLNLLKYSTSRIILQDCSKKQHANVIESPRGIRRTADGAFEADISCTEEREEDFKKPRRAASAIVSYVLPNIRKKLRREDVISNHGFKAPVQTSPSKDEN